MRYFLRILAWSLVGGAVVFLFKTWQAIQDWDRRIKVYEITSGTVSQLVPNADSTQFFPVISFKAIDNQQLKIRSRQPDNSLHLGDSVKVLYDLANPEDMILVHQHPVQKRNIWLSSASVLFVIGLSILLYQWRRQNRVNFLQNVGQVIQANYHSTQKKSFLGFYFYRGHFTAWHRGRQWHFASEWLIGDPTPYWQATTVKVFMNPSQENDYWIDTSALPQHLLI